MIPVNFYYKNPQIKNYEDSVYRISDENEYGYDVDYFKKEVRQYSQIFGFILSFIFVFGILYLSAKDKLRVSEIVGFSFISVLLATVFFSKYFLFGVPVGIFLTVVLILFLLFYIYNIIN
jgi:hypothetical protein